MSAIVIGPNAVEEVQALMEREDLREYFPLISEEEGPKIQFFGGVNIETRETKKGPDQFYMIWRKSKWAVALVITDENKVLLVIQPKPGLAVASLEMPAGGIGAGKYPTEEEVIDLTRAQVLKETGYGGGNASYIGFTIIETGKFFDKDTPLPLKPGVGRGVRAHLVFINGARLLANQELASTEKIQPILVDVNQLPSLITGGVLVETSAVCCITQAILRGLIPGIKLQVG